MTTAHANDERVASMPAAKALQARRQALLSGPIAKTLFSLTLPVIAVIAAQTFVAVLEAYWVSRLGTVAVAGVSLVLPLLILMNTMSNGGVGGGVSSAVSRAVGGGKPDEANELLVHAIVIALVFGLLFTSVAIVLGPQIYSALGGEGATHRNALIYSAWVFGGAPVVWTVNLMGSAMRGAGEVKLPAVVSLIGAALLIPLSPALIFGFGPFPRLGVSGAGAATIVFYLGALAVYLRHLRLGHGALQLRGTPLRRKPFQAILGVGLISAVGTLFASLTVIGVTGTVGRAGTSALAGYGIASRVDALLVPLLFGLGSGVVTLVGVATGAGDHRRADRVTLFASTLAFCATEGVGILLAVAPWLWMRIFSIEPAVLSDGGNYLRVVAPFYGFLGVGLMLYFASQGRSNMSWPFIGGALRLVATVGGAWWLRAHDAPLATVFMAVSVGSILFGAINLLGFVLGSTRARV